MKNAFPATRCASAIRSFNSGKMIAVPQIVHVKLFSKIDKEIDLSDI